VWRAGRPLRPEGRPRSLRAARGRDTAAAKPSRLVHAAVRIDSIRPRLECAFDERVEEHADREQRSNVTANGSIPSPAAADPQFGLERGIYPCESTLVSSVRLFVLAALEENGPMHGHQLRLLAEQQNVGLWTDISVGGLYGIIKRLASEELIEEVRVERTGTYPDRHVWAITDSGREAAGGLRVRGLREIIIKPDPFDLAVTRLHADHLDDLPSIITARIASLRAMLADSEAHAVTVDRYLSITQKLAMKHHAERLRAEITWHEELLGALPKVIAEERARRKT
jgi:DNA-binding PadR family transcriptional regulator